MVIIDPGGDGADLIRRIKERGLKLQAVLLTHGHYDHAHHARMVADAFGVPVYASEKEEATMHDIQKNVSAMFGNPETYDADVYAKDGDVLDLAGFKIKVISTPGHTEGGCCYYFDGNKVLASGDTLFCGSVGRTDFKGGSMSGTGAFRERKTGFYFQMIRLSFRDMRHVPRLGTKNSIICT